MAIELKVPEIGESINEVEIGEWRKKAGDTVQKDETVVVIESDKATIELPSPAKGVLAEIRRKKGETVPVGEIIGIIEDTAAVKDSPAGAPTEEGKSAPSSQTAPEETAAPTPPEPPRVMPAAQRVLAEQQLKPEQIKATGPGGRLLKEDVLREMEGKGSQPAGQRQGGAPVPTTLPTTQEPPAPRPTGGVTGVAGVTEPAREEEVVPMTRLRKTLAERLVQAQHGAALLTTFNEIDMSAVVQLRKDFGEPFQKKNGIKLGFMSFFVKAVVEGLKEVPQVNAEIRGTDIIYHNYYDIGVAVGGGKGLVVPVLRNAERMSFAQIEQAIADLAKRAGENKLKLDELQGGTFTISNGGVYGSLLSTPIVNPPQSGILGLHAIQERPVARDGAVVIRPMMYVALTYDHRLVDGREAVTFLRRIKELIENPPRLLIEV